MSELTPKQQRFVDEYLVDLNATQAAIRAGYSLRTANEQGSRLLAKASVKAAVQAKQNLLAAKMDVTQERIVDELAKIGFANMQDYMRANAEGDPYLDFSGLTREQAAALAEVTVEDFKDGRGETARDVRRVKFKLHDKRAALVDLGRHLGMFKERIEHTGANGGPIRTESRADFSWMAQLTRDERDTLRVILTRAAAAQAASAGTASNPKGGAG
ncbi:phage terminase small subunit [Angulomicrobium tetraedrale]|uniref:Phage terminase small subunit n=1 Tax=Ancylobacter tetraedralis TaxID=217068 RepID=A0A839Z840_9HYPH|nr:terminase small subunit [Ancylobacter tetraedralis]MBB3770970.1 phage terminase small subunit [Ancylobacter tetraedralis]